MLEIFRNYLSSKDSLSRLDLPREMDKRERKRLFMEKIFDLTWITFLLPIYRNYA